MSLFKSLQSLLNQIPDFVRSALGLKQKSYKLLEKLKSYLLSYFQKIPGLFLKMLGPLPEFVLGRLRKKITGIEIVSFF